MATIDPVPALLEELKSSDRHVREAAAEALGKLRDVRAVEPLLVRARDKRWEVQGVVAQALGLIGDLRALDTLLQMYNGETYGLISSDGAQHQYDAIVGGAAIGLAHLYRQSGKPEIFEILTNRFRREIGHFDNSQTPCTVEGLPYTGDRRVTPMLMQAAEASHERLRQRALEALGVLGDPEGLPILYKAVRSGDPLTFVGAAADGLALFRTPDADQPLIAGLYRLESEAFPKDYSWYMARAKIVRALGITGTSGARLALEEHLNANDDDRRTLGAIGLAHMHDRRALQSLIKGLSIGEWWIQAEVATALGVLGDPDVIPALERRLSDGMPTPSRVENAIDKALLLLRQ
jgi:HEAT repeat protein